MKKIRPKKCWGPEASQHAEGCRASRPLCKWMRRKRPDRSACCCSAYHFPHRFSSGACGSLEKQWERIYGPIEKNSLEEAPF